MKVIILGGAGTIGSEVVRDLCQTSDFSEIVIGDNDIKKAGDLVSELKDRRVSVVPVDIRDEEKLGDAIKGFSVVTSTLPFRYDILVTRATLKAKVHGIDVFTTQEQFDLDSQFNAAGITYIIGCGMTPGVTNLLAKRGASEIESAEEINIAWAAYRCFAPAPGLLYTTLWEFDPECEERAYYEEGKMQRVPPFAGAKTVEFAQPIGAQEVYFVSHPEPMTLPRYIPGLKRVTVRGTWPPETMRLLRVFLDFGFYEDRQIRIKGAELTPRDLIYDYFLQIPESKETSLWGYSVHVEVIGWKDGRKVKQTYLTSHPPMGQWGGKRAYAKNVGIPMSIGTQMLAKGQISKHGVFAPEGVIELSTFFSELEKRGISVTEKMRRLTLD